MAVSTKMENNKRKFDKSKPVKLGNNKIKFSDGEEEAKPVNKKIIFDDDGESVAETKPSGSVGHGKKDNKKAADIGAKWYEEYAKFNTTDEALDMKDVEIQELTNSCRASFDTELNTFIKRNPSDAKWLKTALLKGTSRDRANAGALLVQSNPIANLEALETLIGLTKNANKSSTESVDIVTELFISALLPPYRKLTSLPLRGADWKALKKSDADKSTKDKVLAFWHFEAMLKDLYFEFLRNIQTAIQGSQDSNKSQAIIYSSKLLCYAPEKEQMLLSMLVNKLGDPSAKVASKALFHLTEVSYKHPAMCGVIANETEKLLFRQNITEHAQHFTLCFLAQLVPHGNIDVCTKLVNICFSFFKILVNKGTINSRTMQAILRCLKHAIRDVVSANEANPGIDNGFMSKDTQDTIYRLIHFADIPTSMQTLALLLQVMTVIKTGSQQDRFYNALYKKILDPKLGTCGAKFSGLFLHIVHKAIHIDTNTSRAQAFIKRLLQVSLYFPAQMLCGTLIVINKIVKSRPELNKFEIVVKKEFNDDNDSNDDEEHYADAPDEDESGDKNESVVKNEPATNGDADVKPKAASWYHANHKNSASKGSQISAVKYNPLNRVPAFAGAEFVLRTELCALLNHYHPSVRVFAQNLIDNISIQFYGDPIKDFSLTQFLDRFVFKNPKKPEEKKADSIVQAVHKKQYAAHGSRGQSIKQLTSSNCTEDERYIFAYLEKKREVRAALADENDVVDDDEFEAYLDSLAGKKKKKTGANDEDLDDELDFLGELGGDRAEKAEKPRKPRKNVEEGEDNDWDDGSEGESDGGDDNDHDDDDDDEFGGSDDEGSVSLDGEDDDDDDDMFEDDSDPEDNESGESGDEEPKAKKMRPMTSKEFQRKLKHTDNMDSLFAAADDFSEMLEETGKSKKHGTLGEIFNQDKSSERQMEWEQNRMKQNKNFKTKKAFHKKPQKRNRSQGKNRRGEAPQQKLAAKKGRK